MDVWEQIKVKQRPRLLWRSKPSRIVLASLTLAIALDSTVAMAEGSGSTSTGNSTSAESLFVTGQELMAAGEFDKACSAFEASHQYEPAVGTLLNLARCYESSGLVASAWSTFSQAASMARQLGQEEREALARNEVIRLRPLVPQVVIEVDGLSADWIVKLDGLVLAHDVLEFGTAVDPGEHQVEVSATGKKSAVKTIQVVGAVGSAPMTVSIEGLQDEPAAAEMTVVDGKNRPANEPEFESNESIETPKGGWTTLRWVGFGTGIVGITSVVVGAVIGIDAKNKANGADCDESGCSEEGLRESDDAQDQLKLGYIVGISGGVLAAGGITLFALSPGRANEDIALKLHLPSSAGAGFSLAGSF